MYSIDRLPLLITCLITGLISHGYLYADDKKTGLTAAEETEAGTTIVEEIRAPRLNIQRDIRGGYLLQAGIQIAAPVNIVWDILRDCGQALHYVPGMRECKVLEAGPDYDVASHRVRRYRLLPSVDYIFRSEYHPYRRVDVQLLEGDLRRLEGYWQFESCGKRCTELSYDFSVEAGWLVPGSVERKALSQDVPEMLSRLQQQAETWFEESLRLFGQ